MEIDGRFIRSPQRKVVRGGAVGEEGRGIGVRAGGTEAGRALMETEMFFPSPPPPPAVSPTPARPPKPRPQMKTKAERAAARRGSAGAQLLGHILHPASPPTPAHLCLLLLP